MVIGSELSAALDVDSSGSILFLDTVNHSLGPNNTRVSTLKASDLCGKLCRIKVGFSPSELKNGVLGLDTSVPASTFPGQEVTLQSVLQVYHEFSVEHVI